jgi:hypothetical protein
MLIISKLIVNSDIKYRLKGYIHFDKNGAGGLGFGQNQNGSSCLPRRMGAYMSRKTTDATKWLASCTLFTTNSLHIFSLGVMLFSLQLPAHAGSSLVDFL